MRKDIKIVAVPLLYYLENLALSQRGEREGEGKEEEDTA